jgi:ABC-type Na+ efflux pump permease subunit
MAELEALNALLAESGLAGLGAIIAGALIVFLVIYVLVMIAVYIYMALALMKVAQRTKTKNAWLAWIPIGNIYLMSKIAKMPWWPILLLLVFWIPFVNILAMLVFGAFVCAWTWKICEARKRPGWWAIITIVPGIGGIWSFIMWGILAWGKD